MRKTALCVSKWLKSLLSNSLLSTSSGVTFKAIMFSTSEMSFCCLLLYCFCHLSQKMPILWFMTAKHSLISDLLSRNQWSTTWVDRILLLHRSYWEYLLYSDVLCFHHPRRCIIDARANPAVCWWKCLSSGTNPQGILVEYGSGHHHFVSWHSLDPLYTWLLPVVGMDEETQWLMALRVGVNDPLPSFTATLKAFGRWVGHPGRLATPTRIVLVNAKSLANKTFILNNFFTSHGLDFLCVTETWNLSHRCCPPSSFLKRCVRLLDQTSK